MKSSLALLVVLLGVAYGSGHWGYFSSNGPLTWPQNFAECAGLAQSPINIDTSAVTEEAIGAFTFTGYDDTTATLTITNNGHSAQLSSSAVPSISGGGLDETFHFAQLHFHWGTTSAEGSEHTVNSQAYPLEIHLVHWRESLGNFSNAASVSGGLAIIGVLLEVSAEDNPAFDGLVNSLDYITFNGETTTVPTFALSSILPSNTECYYRYTGSLTTPTCYESGIWTVMANTVSISETQLSNFRALYFNAMGEEVYEPMVNNYRPVQPLNGRTVKLNQCAAAATVDAVAATDAAATEADSTEADSTEDSTASTTTASGNIFKRIFKRIFRQ